MKILHPRRERWIDHGTHRIRFDEEPERVQAVESMAENKQGLRAWTWCANRVGSQSATGEDR